MGILSWSTARLYDTVMQHTEKVCLGPWRRELLADLSGSVLEIGAGTGANLDYYPETITEYVLAEPDHHMRQRLAKKLASRGLTSRLYDNVAENLPFADNAFDNAVATLVLCSVSSPGRSLEELYRVLRPGGSLILIEHVVDPNRSGVYRWQRRIEPFWRCCAGNCHLTRDTFSTLNDAGFDCRQLQRDSMHGAVSLVAPVIRGIAKKP
ncbi:MAG: methyltransferase type 11 [Desulfuromonas sp.]|nr:MAG: methyltransferase type 11 [Desulfuromonas sp.]